MSKPINSFFAYPSQPASIQEIVRITVDEINKSQECHIKTWQDCTISGKIIIDVICREIENADLFIADLTGANPNVLFELGYAISMQKKIWLLLDTSIQESKSLFDQLRILTTVGYSPYSNSQDMINEFYKEQLWMDMDKTIFAMSIEPRLDENEERHLLYLKNQHEIEASIKLSRIIDSFQIPKKFDDPKESTVQTLEWYATNIWKAFGVIAHFSGKSRHGHRLHNSRYAFISGLVHGFQKPLLMLAEADYQTPIDYRDILRQYNTASECEPIAKEWIEPISLKYNMVQRESGEYRKKVALATGLRNLNLGEYLAENEEDILDEYFIETQPFLKVIEGNHTIFIGRKGSGKTANLYMAAKKISEDRRNLVCVIKPVSYDVQGIVRLGKEIKEKDKKGYLSESLWKFLIFSEIALTAYKEIVQRQYVDPESPEFEFKKVMDEEWSILKDDFAVRLEQCIKNLLSSSNSKEDSLYNFHGAISEILHESILHNLRHQLGVILSNRKRVVILIDNLDKAWDRKEDLEHLSDFIFGLLRVANDISKEFAKHDYRRKPVNISITIFLRSDIFNRVIKHAREPDKIHYDRLAWEDPVVLMRVIDKRLAVNREECNPELLWKEFFCQTVGGMPIKDYILNTILPRPRDLVYFIKAALSTAVNRGHGRIGDDDILEAEKLYSQFVFEGIQVENGISLPELEYIMFEFVGGKSILYRNEVFDIISKSGIIEQNRQEYALRHLMALSFLGVEVGLNKFRYCTNTDEIQKLERLSNRYGDNNAIEPRYKIHKAFHAYLEVEVI